MENSAGATAMSKSSVGKTSMPSGIERSSGEVPSELFMIDNGTFWHMAGTGAMHLAVNVQVIDPYLVITAGGEKLYLMETCDLILNGCEFIRCLVNPSIRTTLLSEGRMHMDEGWTVENSRSG